MSAFSKAVGAATAANKQTPPKDQTQIQGNPLGIAAVLLQGAQGNNNLVQDIPAVVGFGSAPEDFPRFLLLNRSFLRGSREEI